MYTLIGNEQGEKIIDHQFKQVNPQIFEKKVLYSQINTFICSLGNSDPINIKKTRLI